MYDPKWPHGHTYSSAHYRMRRVLADDLKSSSGKCIAIVCEDSWGDDVVRIVSPVDLDPIPASKKRIQGWLNIYPDCGSELHNTKCDADIAADKSRRLACIYIDVPEGTGLEESK